MPGAGQMAQLNEILLKLGLPADTAGLTTMFAQLAQIRTYTDALEGTVGAIGDVAGTTSAIALLKQINNYVDTVETLLGLTGDASSGTGTVMARLAAIRDTLANNTNRVGVSTDAAGTTTLFARLAQIAGYTDSLESVLGTSADAANFNSIYGALRQTDADAWNAWNRANAAANAIGANTDAASMASTVFAALKALNAKSGGLDLSAMTPNFYNYGNQNVIMSTGSAGAPTSLDLVTINTAGILTDFKATTNYMNGSYGFCLVVDGVEKLLYTLSGGSVIRTTQNSYIAVTNGTTSFYDGIEFNSVIKFNSSLIIRLKNHASSFTNMIATINMIYHT